VSLRLEVQRCEAKTAAGLIRYSLFRSPRRKSLTICVKADKEVHVFAPLFLSKRKILDFVQKKAFWIVKSAQKLESRFANRLLHHYCDGERFLFLGKEHLLCYVPSKLKRLKVERRDPRIEVSVPIAMPCDQIEKMVQKALFAWYRHEAQRVVKERALFWRQKLNIDVNKMVVRSQKRIWGSSYHRTKRVNINWKIIMAPLEVIDYVIVHELCHFSVPNHSRSFWEKVKDILPGYEDAENWLKEHEALTYLA